VSKHTFILITALTLPGIPAYASDDAVLGNGFRIHAERYELQGDHVLLYASGGVTDLPASSIDRFEHRDDPPAPALATEIHQPTAAVPDAPPSPLPASPRELLRDAAQRSGLPAAFVESVARVESAFRPDAISPKGAIGVMQLMPETARTMDADPHDTAQNIDAGVRLLRDLLLKYDGDVIKALAAYNAGTEAVERYRGVPPYPETQIYVDRVLRTYIRSGGR
jgi:soluble lytic murein transglycosylase-like protein